MSMEDLIVRLRIEEDNKRSEKLQGKMVEHGQSSKKNKYGKGSKLGPKGGVSKKPKFQGKCFNYDKMGHKSVDCK